MVLLSIKGDPKQILNPAFTRFHPKYVLILNLTS